MAQAKVFYATGKRKTSSARVFLKSGSGKITINGKTPEQYLGNTSGRISVAQPFIVSNLKSKYDAFVTVSGGGTTGQAEAVRHGISRALCVAEPEVRGPLKAAGFLTRDSRMVERKKYGLHKARKRGQYSKR